jgi:hypothetical protein
MPGRQEIRVSTRNEGDMTAHERLLQRVSVEQDDVLATLQLVQGDDALEARLFEQLVDLLIEAMFLSLRQDYLDGELSHDAYVAQLGVLAATCRSAGLLPLPGSDA